LEQTEHSSLAVNSGSWSYPRRKWAIMINVYTPTFHAVYAIAFAKNQCLWTIVISK